MTIKKLLVITIIIGLLISGCVNKPSGNVKIAFSVPLGTTYGQDSLHAVEMAIKKANGKAGPYNVELMVLSETEPNSESISTPLVIQNAEKVAQDPSVVGWVGPDSSRTAKEIIPILNRASVTTISGSNTWPGLTKPGYELGEPGIYYPTGQRTYFRTVASDEVQGAAAARWIQKMGYQKVYIIYGEDVYGKGVAGVFEITAKDIGLGIVGKSGFTTEGDLPTATAEALVTKALDASPDIIFLAGSVGSNAEYIVRAIRQANATIPLMGPDGIAVDDIFALLEKEQLENIYGTVVAIPPANLDTPAARDFVRSYQNEYGKTPSSYDGAIYEAVNVLLYAIGRAEQPTREAVFASMQNLGEYSGIFGTWHFDPQGDISPSAIGGMKVVDGAWTFVETLK